MGAKTKENTSNQLSKFNEIITIEDHFEDGGFGSWVSECINKFNKKITIKHKFISTKVMNQVGSKNFNEQLWSWGLKFEKITFNRKFWICWKKF